MKVLIADDHAIVREGLKQIIIEALKPGLIEEAGDGMDALKKAMNNEYDIIILDITMPNKSGLEVLKQIKDNKPEVPVLILSMHEEDQYALRVIKAGASGYLTKIAATEELIKAIEKVLNGGIYISESCGEKLALSLQNDSTKYLHETLSDREYLTMCRIGAGKTLTEIAKELSLSVKTITTFRARILEKMKMNTNADIIRYTIEKDLKI